MTEFSFTFSEADNFRPFEREVRRGIELLDSKVPEWRERMDWDRLDMSSCSLCVGAQAYRGQYASHWAMPWTPYRFAMNELGLFAENDVDKALGEHGFVILDDAPEGWTYQVLAEEWRRQANG